MTKQPHRLFNSVSTDKALGKGVIWGDNHVELVWGQFPVELDVVAGGVRISGAKAGVANPFSSAQDNHARTFK